MPGKQGGRPGKSKQGINRRAEVFERTVLSRKTGMRSKIFLGSGAGLN